MITIGLKEHFKQRSQNYNSYTKWLKDPELFRLCTMPLNDCIKNIKCLDIGGGTGWLAYEDYKNSGRNWTVVDISENMGEFVPKEIKFICANAENIPLPNNSFDFIIIRSVLEYTNIDLALTEVKRLLKEEGYFVLAQKVLDGFASDVNLYLELERLRNPLKKNLGFMSNILSHISKTGLKILNNRTYTQDYSIDFDIWLNRDNTIPKINQEKLKDLIIKLPNDVKKRTGLMLVENIFICKITWGIFICQKNSYINPQIDIVVSIIVEKNYKNRKSILLQKRKYLFTEPQYYDVWELPQGKIEKNETIIQSAKRELYEETSMKLVENIFSNNTIKVNDITLERQDILTTVFSKGGINYLGICIIVKAEGNPKSKIQNMEHKWIDVNCLPEIIKEGNVFPLNIPMLQKYVDYIDKRNNVTNIIK